MAISIFSCFFLIWQAHWLNLVGINLCAKNDQSISMVSRVIGIFAVIFWPRHCLGQGEVTLVSPLSG